MYHIELLFNQFNLSLCAAFKFTLLSGKGKFVKIKAYTEEILTQKNKTYIQKGVTEFTGLTDIFINSLVRKLNRPWR